MPAVRDHIDTQYSPPDKACLWNKFAPYTGIQTGVNCAENDSAIGTIDSSLDVTDKVCFSNFPETELQESTEMGSWAGFREAICRHLPSIWKSLETQLGALSNVPPEVLPDTRTIPDSAVDKSKRDDFVFRIMSAFDQETLEDGFSHPAEDIIRKALSGQHFQVTHWLQSTISQGENPCLAASILRCLGRIEEDNCTDWTYSLASSALKHSDVEVRDAAAQLLEMCGTSHAASLLKDHDESVPWLKDYIHRVVKEIELRKGRVHGLDRT
jgi:hypothetical protein